MARVSGICAAARVAVSALGPLSHPKGHHCCMGHRHPAGHCHPVGHYHPMEHHHSKRHSHRMEHCHPMGHCHPVGHHHPVGRCHSTRHQHPVGHRYSPQHCHPSRQALSPTGHCHRVPAPVLAASSLLCPRALPAQGHDGLLWLCLLGDRNPFCFFCLPGDTGISWLLRDQITLPCLGTGSLSAYMGTSSFVPDQGHGALLATQGEYICLPGDVATFISLGTAALSAYCQPTQGHGHLLAPWGQEPLLPLLPAWGNGHLLAPRGKIVSASTGTCASSGYSGTGSSACLGTWLLPSAWGQECSLLTASLLRNMVILQIPGDQITSPCMGTGSLRTRTWGQQHFH